MSSDDVSGLAEAHIQGSHSTLWHPARRPPAPAPWLHEEVARRMAQRLPLLRAQPQRCMDVDGWRSGSADLLRQAYPRAQVDMLFPNAHLQSVHALAARQPAWRRLFSARGERNGLESAPPTAAAGATAGATAGLLWANMVLHQRPDWRLALRHWVNWLQPDGFMMMSCLGPDTLRELREVHAGQGWGMATPSFVDMHDIGDEMVRAGFADPVMDMERVTLTYRDQRTLLADLRALGANSHPQRFQGCRTLRWRDAWWQALSTAAGNGPVSLSFEVIYGHAFKAQPRVAMQAETRVDMSDMRRLLRRPSP